MNKKEVAEILEVLKVNYPQSFKNWDKKQIEMFVDLWYNGLKNYDTKIVNEVLHDYIYHSDSAFAPSVGMIISKIDKMQDNVMTEQEAWALVYKALENSGYHAEEEFNKLPSAVQRVVGSPNMLRSWAMMNYSELDTVVASNFQRSYRAVAKKESELQHISIETREKLKIDSLINRFKLEDKYGK